MAWFSGWSYRQAITVDMSGKSGAGTNDMQVTIPTTWEHFWDTIDSSGNEIRVCSADGTTELAYEWKTITKATKTGVLDVDDVAYSNAPSVVMVFLYYGKSGASDGSTVFSLTAQVTGYIELLEGYNTIRAASETPGALVPRVSVPLTKDAKLAVSISLEGVLRGVCSTQGKRTLGEEVQEIMVALNDTDDALVSGPVVNTETRINSCRRQVCQTLTTFIDGADQGVSDATDYVLSVIVYTSNSRTINIRVGVRVNDVRPRA